MANPPPPPPGFVLSGASSPPPPPPGFVLAAKAAPVNEAQQPNTWGQAIKNVGEAGLKLGSGIVGNVAGSIAGLGATAADAANSLLPGRGPGDLFDPSAIRDRVSGALTYEPSNPESLSSRIVDFPGKVIQGSSEYLTKQADKSGLPYVGGLAGAVPEVALNLLGIKGAKALKNSKATQPKAPATAADVQRAQIREAIDSGYSVQPRQVPGALVGDAIEGMTNSAKLERTLSKKNQQVTNSIARKEAGLKGDGPISQAQLDDARIPHFEIYDEVAKSGKVIADETFAREMFNIGKETDQLVADFPQAANAKMLRLRNSYLEPEFDATSAVRSIRKLRKESKQYFKAFDDPEKQALGQASREIADALEGALERHLEASGRAGLMDKFRSARKQLAKINNIDEALSEASGNVDAAYFGKLLDRGAPLTGGLETIAKTAKRFGRAVQLPEKMPAKGPGVLDLGAGVVGGLAAGPAVGIAALGVPFAARQLLASRMYQRGLAGGRKAGALSPGASVSAAQTRKQDE